MIDWKGFKGSQAVWEKRVKTEPDLPKEVLLVPVEILTEATDEVARLRIILADIIRTLSEKDLADVKFERARKKGINYVFDQGKNP